MMKRLLSALLALLLLALPLAAGAEILPVDTDYIHYGDYGRPIGDLHAILGLSWLDADADEEPYFCSATLNNLLEYQEFFGLEPTGFFDPATLRCMFGLGPGSDAPVWIPMHGGARYHRYESCSNMIEPRQMPVDCAEYLGFTPCKRCY